MKIAGLIDDLFFTSKFREIAKSLGAEAAIYLAASAVPDDVARIFVDLSATQFDPVAEIARLKQTGPATPITGFFSHVQIDMKERALNAGADEVVPRSAFAQRVSDVLTVIEEPPV